MNAIALQRTVPDMVAEYEAKEYEQGLIELRRQFLAERRDSESCSEWIERAGRKFGRVV